MPRSPNVSWAGPSTRKQSFDRFWLHTDNTAETAYRKSSRLDRQTVNDIGYSNPGLEIKNTSDRENYKGDLNPHRYQGPVPTSYSKRNYANQVGDDIASWTRSVWDKNDKLK